ncbi:MAG: class I adenylate-forming enzyme family protein [Solirubrobacteraceae bacterium]
MSTLAFQPDAERYYSEGYWRDGDLWGEFARSASASPAKTALHVDGQRISYDELRRAAIALSARLARNEVRRGDVVLLLGRNSIEAAVVLLACFHLGAVAAPLPPMFGRAQLAELAAQAGARALISFGREAEIQKCEGLRGQLELVMPLCPDDIAALISETAEADRDPAGADELALLLHSSGTTSVPKGIMHSSNTLRYATEQILERWELTGEDTNLVVCEFGFVGSLVFGYLVTLLSGATGVLLPRWNAEEALRLIEHHRCTYVLYMPTHGADILRAGGESDRDWSSMRVLVATGLSEERRISMHEVFGRQPLADYGLSEIPGHIAHGLSEPREKVIKTEGIPFHGTQVQILDPLGNPAQTGELGAVVVNGPSRFLGFFANDSLTRESLTDAGGYKTGDLGSLDADGHFTYGGRSKDIIRRGGVTLVPAEIEAAILKHPAIQEVAVVPLPDDRLGERACAAVVVEPGNDAPGLGELQDFLASQGMSKYSWPESVEVFEDFPRTPSLKVVKRDLVKAIVDRATMPA